MKMSSRNHQHRNKEVQETTLENNRSPLISNISTRIYVRIVGTMAGLAGLAHGVFEILQGNKPTVDILLRIGAYTIIPNYLLTGIASAVISLTIIFWTFGFIHKSTGTIIYLLLLIILFLVGGGIAPIIGLLITWAVATRINKPLTWWKKILPEKSRQFLAKFWLIILITGMLFLITGIGIWLILTPPGEIYQINIVDYICWSLLGLGSLFQIPAIISGFVRDIEIQDRLSQKSQRQER
jgi:hypothetical protein